MGNMPAALVGGAGDLGERAGDGLLRIGVHADLRRVAELQLHDFAIGERRAHDVAALARADDQHRLAGGHHLALFGELAQHHAVAAAP